MSQTNMSKASKRHTQAKITLGVLTDNSHQKYQAGILMGLFNRAQELNVRLVCFAGGAIHRAADDEYLLQRNKIYQLASSDIFDGLIIPGTVGNYATAEEFEAFHQQYQSIPRVSVGTPVPGIPAIVADNKSGLYDTISHLITDHNARRIAFFSGPHRVPEAIIRFETYKDALAQHGIPFDEALVFPGNFSVISGREAARHLLEQQLTVDAIVAANDNLALGALEVLQAEGINIPEDMALTGFDDIADARYATPPFTTVRQPLEDMGGKAVEVMLSILAGEAVAEEYIVPTQMVTRQSCGCASHRLLRAAIEPAPAAETKPYVTVSELISNQQEALRAEMESALRTEYPEQASNWVGQILDALTNVEGTIHETEVAFLSTLERILRNVALKGGNILRWQNQVSILRRRLIPQLGAGLAATQIENLCNQARILIAEAAERVQIDQRLRDERRTVEINALGAGLVTSLQEEELLSTLEEWLPRLEINQASVALYEDANPGLRLALKIDENGRVELGPEQVHCPSPQAALATALLGGNESLLILPLFFQNEMFGFIAMQLASDFFSMYEILRNQLSSAIKGARLIQERTAQERELERLLAEVRRLATIVEDHPDFIGVGTLAGDALYVNPAGLKMMGLPLDFDITTMHLGNFYAEEDAEFTLKTGLPAALEGGAWTAEVSLLKTDGNLITVEQTIAVNYGGDGNAASFSVTMRDITDRKKAEAELEDRLLELSNMQRAVSREGWQRAYKARILANGYLFDEVTVSPADDLWQPAIMQAVEQRSLVAATETQAAAVTPLSIYDEVVGALGVYQNPDDPLTQDELDLITSVSEQMAQALESARLAQQTQEALSGSEEQARRLALLNEMSATLSLVASLDDIYQISVEQTLEMLSLDWVSLVVLNPDQTSLEVVALSGEALDVSVGEIIRLAGTPMERALRDRSIVHSQTETMGSVTVAPLYTSQGGVGTLNVGRRATSGFTHEDEGLIRQITSLLSAGIENKRLLEQTQSALSETQTLYDVSQKLTTSSTLEESLENIVKTLTEHGLSLGANNVTLTSIEVDEAGAPDSATILAWWLADNKEPPYPVGTNFSLKTASTTALWQANPSNPLLISNIETDERLNEETRGLYLYGGTKATAMLPLSAAGRWVGLLNISWSEPFQFTTLDERVYGALIGQLSTLVENQRLIAEMQERATELEETTSFLDTIFDFIPVGLFVKDAQDFRFVRWNQANEAIIGLQKDEVLGKSDYDFFPKEEADYFVNADRSILAAGEQVDIPEEQIHTAHRGVRTLHTRKVPIYAADGSPRYILGISEDITDDKEADRERERLLSEVQRLAAIVENHPDFIGVGTMDGHAVYVNPAGLTMMGLPPDHDVTMMEAGDFFPPEDATKLMNDGIPIALEQGSWSSEANLLRADGTTVPVEETVGINYDAQANPVSFSITMRDIAERKQADVERERLLTEVQAAYSQYVQREWGQFLRDQSTGGWRVEHQQANLPQVLLKEISPRMRQSAVSEGKVQITSRNNGSVEADADVAMVAPISLRGQVIGTLSLQDIDPDRRWTDEEVALVEAVSEQLAQTVENLRLFGDTQRRAGREQLVREITDKMRSLPDIDSVINTGLRELAQSLGVSRTYVRLTPTTTQLQAVTKKIEEQ